MPALYLTETDVAALARMPDAIACMDALFKNWGEIAAQNVARQRIKMPKGMFNLLGAGYSPADVFGVKAYFASPAGARFQIQLYSAKDGAMLAIIEADHLSKLRTGAASAIATQVLARPDAQTLALIGTGQQALTQAEAICAVRKITRIHVFSRNEDKRAEFAQKLGNRLNIEITAAPSAEACVRAADIVTTITKSSEPVCLGAWLKPGTHINAAGANAAARRELDDEAVLKSAVKCTDSVSQAKMEAGEFISLASAGRLNWSAVSELGTLAPQGTTRPNSDAITLFKSLGIGMEDVAFAEWIYRQAVAQKIGSELPF